MAGLMEPPPAAETAQSNYFSKTFHSQSLNRQQQQQQQEEVPWAFAQCFGDKEEEEDISRINDGDLISTVAFDQSGDFLASGDRAGRVVLFQRNNNSNSKRSSSATYRFYAEFQSHEPEFDYLKSLEINERINRIGWCRRINDSHHLLTTNDKTVKLWKVRQRSVHAVVENNASVAKKLTSSSAVVSDATAAVIQIPLCLPQTRLASEPVVTAVPRSVFANAHTYNLHSISPSADGELFLSADDLRINLWNLQDAHDRSFNLIDMKPNNLEELYEVITSATFHPSHGHLFAFATSRGSVRLCDMRQAAFCDRHARQFGPPKIDPDLYYSNGRNSNNSSAAAGGDPTCFKEIVTSISDLKFSPCGRYFLTRDYLHLHLWDTHMAGNQPILTQAVHPAVVPQLCDLYENDYIFDKFEAGWTGDGRSVLTGSYSNYLRIFPTEGSGGFDNPQDPSGLLQVRRGGGQVIQATKAIFRSSKKAAGKAAAVATMASLLTPGDVGGTFRKSHLLDWIPPPVLSRSNSRSSTSRIVKGEAKREESVGLDWDRKVQFMSVHPHENIVALAALSNLFIFAQPNHQQQQQRLGSSLSSNSGSGSSSSSSSSHSLII